MKVNIFTEAGNNIGWGHVSRCLALYEELIDREIEVQMIIYGEFNHHRMLDSFNYIKADWKQKEFLERFQFENSFAIVDSYLADFDTYKYISDSTLKSLFIDDTNRLEYPSGIILNPAFDTTSIDYRMDKNKAYLIGKEYTILRKTFSKKILMKTRENVERVLFIDSSVLNNSLIQNLTPFISDLLKKYKVDIISNLDYEEISKNKNLIRHFNLTAEEVKKLISKADIVIASAGQVINELIISEKPLIPIILADNQKYQVEALVNSFPFIEPIHINNPQILVKVSSAFKNLLSIENRRKFLLISKSINCHSTRNVINEFLFNYSNNSISLRLSSIADSQSILNLSNEPIVRSLSLSTKQIDEITHQKWFDNVLNGDKIILFIVQSVYDDFLGYVKFDRMKNANIVGIALNKKIRGQSKSALILFQAIKLFRSEYDKKIVKAIIKKENLASLRLFKKIGFYRFKEEKDKVIYLYD